MNNKEKRAIIARLKTKDKRRKIYHDSISDEYKDDKDIIDIERRIGIRRTDSIGFDVIDQTFFVNESLLYYNEFVQKEIWRKSSKKFEDFDSYYEYLNGEIYDNACYYQCDFSKVGKELDKSKLYERKSFITDNIDNYTVAPSVDEEAVYKKNERNRKQCKAWIKKYRNSVSCEELTKNENNYRKSKLCSVLTENSGFFSGMYRHFMLWNYIYDAKNDARKFSALMEYMSNYSCTGTLVREVCGIFNPKDIVERYNYTGSSRREIYKQKKKLRDIADAFNNGHVDSRVSAFFDERTHYYCERVRYILKNEKACCYDNIMRELSTYRFFETFEDFVEYRKGDLTNTDLSKDIKLDCDLSQYKMDNTTKLPIGTVKNLRYNVKKEYSNGKFVVEQAWYNENNVELKRYVHRFDYFFDFVAFLNGDLSGSDLLLCDGLKNLKDVSGIDFTEAKITSSICDKFGIRYKDYSIDTKKVESFEETRKYEKNTALVLQASREIAVSDNNELCLSVYDMTTERVYYISDLHLMHKLEHSKPKSKTDVVYVLQNIINNIVSETGNLLLIGGDVASDYTIFELFIRLLRDELDKRRRSPDVIFILGNHELWEFPGLAFNKIVEKYEKLITECGMYLLQNNIIYKDSEHKIHRINNSELIRFTDKKIREKVRTSRIMFFGGLAFSGYNENFNADKGIYRSTISRAEEIKESRKFERLYNKVLSALPDKKLVIFTHMPMDCWGEEANYHKDYVYVSGHTHRNYFYDDGEVRIYADNQIGYANNNPHLKWFDLDNEYDYFSDYKDGIYEISREDYYKFYRGKNIQITFNRKVNVLYMLKKNGYYCFIYQSNGGSLNILNGGALKKLDRHDIRYYYDNMDTIIGMIKKPLDKYTGIQEKIALEIRKLGGDGTIHGCIVDIDCYNHIYVNPYDMKITGYSASDIINKTVYPSVPALLEKECPAMYEKYTKLLKGNSKNLPMLAKNVRADISVLPQTYLDTDIYRSSREIKKMQKLSSNILTAWFKIDDGRNKAIESKKKR